LRLFSNAVRPNSGPTWVQAQKYFSSSHHFLIHTGKATSWWIPAETVDATEEKIELEQKKGTYGNLAREMW